MRIGRRALPVSAGFVLPGLLIAGIAVTRHTSRAVERLPVSHVRGALVTATPTPTPRPTLTPIPTPTPGPHVRTGGISYELPDLQILQAAADRGGASARYALNPVAVTLHDLPHLGFRPGAIQAVDPTTPRAAPTAHTGEDGRPETDVIVRFRGRQYWIVLNQFVRHGPGGIWSIITITPMSAG